MRALECTFLSFRFPLTLFLHSGEPELNLCAVQIECNVASFQSLEYLRHPIEYRGTLKKKPKSSQRALSRRQNIRKIGWRATLCGPRSIATRNPQTTFWEPSGLGHGLFSIHQTPCGRGVKRIVKWASRWTTRSSWRHSNTREVNAGIRLTSCAFSGARARFV